MNLKKLCEENRARVDIEEMPHVLAESVYEKLYKLSDHLTLSTAKAIKGELLQKINKTQLWGTVEEGGNVWAIKYSDILDIINNTIKD